MAHDGRRRTVQRQEDDWGDLPGGAGAVCNGLGYCVDKAHADDGFEIEGAPREVIDAFSPRRSEIEAAMAVLGMGESKNHPHLSAKATLLTRAAKRDIDRRALERG